ncbi:MAG: nucleotidyltransferase substrate binding protein [Rhodothermaceae bacterium]|nr:nucleotidyltransferase substrate binding protein [Rhodothermaceae bacterium]
MEIRGPKPVLIEAYAQKWINDEKKWIDLLNARNLTSHVYNEQRPQEIDEMILENSPMMHIEYAALEERFADYLK